MTAAEQLNLFFAQYLGTLPTTTTGEAVLCIAGSYKGGATAAIRLEPNPLGPDTAPELYVTWWLLSVANDPDAANASLPQHESAYRAGFEAGARLRQVARPTARPLKGTEARTVWDYVNNEA